MAKLTLTKRTDEETVSAKTKGGVTLTLTKRPETQRPQTAGGGKPQAPAPTRVNRVDVQDERAATTEYSYAKPAGKTMRSERKITGKLLPAKSTKPSAPDKLEAVKDRRAPAGGMKKSTPNGYASLESRIERIDREISDLRRSNVQMFTTSTADQAAQRTERIKALQAERKELLQPTRTINEESWKRWEALARKEGALTDAEMQEAKAAVRALRGSVLYRLSPNWMSAEEQAEYQERMKLAAAIEQRTSTGPAAWEGMTSRLPGVKQARAFAEGTLDTAKANPYMNPDYQGRTDHPAAYLVGQGVMDLAEYKNLGNLGQWVAKGAPFLSKLPTAVQNMVGSGITFGAKGALDAAAEGGTPEEIAKAAGIGFAGGAAGSGASQAVGKLGTGLLFRTGTQNAVPAVILRDTLSGTAFAGADMGTRMALDKEYRPTKEEAVKDLAVAGAFSALSSLAGTLTSTREARSRMERDISAMKRDYASIVDQADGQTTAAALDDLAAKSAQVRDTLRTTQYVGQQKTVDAVTEFLDELDDAVSRARGQLAGAGTAGAPVQGTPLPRGAAGLTPYRPGPGGDAPKIVPAPAPGGGAYLPRAGETAGPYLDRAGGVPYDGERKTAVLTGRQTGRPGL